MKDDRPTLERFRELRAASEEAIDKEAARSIVRELKAVGGNLRVVRRALTGGESGGELWSILVSLSREETIRRIDAAL
jgi:anticodon-binding protein